MLLDRVNIQEMEEVSRCFQVSMRYSYFLQPTPRDDLQLMNYLYLYICYIQNVSDMLHIVGIRIVKYAVFYIGKYASCCLHLLYACYIQLTKIVREFKTINSLENHFPIKYHPLVVVLPQSLF